MKKEKTKKRTQQPRWELYVSSLYGVRAVLKVDGRWTRRRVGVEEIERRLNRDERNQRRGR